MISIHAPTRGATLKQVQPRTKNGISIHAPTRGATYSVSLLMPKYLFQSTLPREERPYAYQKDIPIIISIHAPTRGATWSNLNTKIRIFDFNPRSHERSDATIAKPSTITVISIHAPTRGATNWRVMYPITIEFQSTLPREERQ